MFWKATRVTDRIRDWKSLLYYVWLIHWMQDGYSPTESITCMTTLFHFSETAFFDLKNYSSICFSFVEIANEQCSQFLLHQQRTLLIPVPLNRWKWAQKHQSFDLLLKAGRHAGDLYRDVASQRKLKRTSYDQRWYVDVLSTKITEPLWVDIHTRFVDGASYCQTDDSC